MSLVSKSQEKVDLYFSILKVPVDVLRSVEQIEHLPDGELKVHLTEVEYPPEILKIVNININGRHRHNSPPKAKTGAVRGQFLDSI